MNAEKFKEAYARLQALDDKTYRVRPRSGGLTRPSIEQLEEKMHELADYTIDLKEIVDDLFQAIAAPS